MIYITSITISNSCFCDTNKYMTDINKYISKNLSDKLLDIIMEKSDFTHKQLSDYSHVYEQSIHCFNNDDINEILQLINKIKENCFDGISVRCISDILISKLINNEDQAKHR